MARLGIFNLSVEIDDGAITTLEALLALAQQATSPGDLVSAVRQMQEDDPSVLDEVSAGLGLMKFAEGIASVATLDYKLSIGKFVRATPLGNYLSGFSTATNIARGIQETNSIGRVEPSTQADIINN